MSVVVIVHLSTTFAMAGIIWLIQCVQYPLFAEVGQSHFARFHESHVRRIGFVVAPLMLIEAITGVALLWYLPLTLELFSAFVFLALVWISTFLLQVPLHHKLSAAYCEASVRKLVRSNWLRTVAWTARALILISITPQWLST